ncbi:MAG: B12-binding domain-containing radical SAM protein [Candidatus Helarchaeota archaeon]
MELDLVLVLLPAYTQDCPSLGLTALTTYLTEKGYNLRSFDYSVQFFKYDFPKFSIQHSLVKQLHVSLYPLWGISHWLHFPQIIAQPHGRALIQSLCPVALDLYQPLFDEFGAKISRYLQTLKAYTDKLAALPTATYGFSLHLSNAISSLYVIKQLKQIKPESTIIVGGPEAFPSFRARFYSQIPEIDFTVYHSEGEVPLERILAHLKEKIPKNEIPGVCINSHHTFYKTNPSPLLDIDQLPIPQFQLVDTGISPNKLKSIDLLISKGCPYNCLFCNEPSIWGSYRPKSPKKIYEEIQYYLEHFGITHFELNDNSFSTSPSLQSALKKLYDAGYQFKWGGNCRANELSSKKLQQFARLGLNWCYFGAESASPTLLQIMRKQIDPNHLFALLSDCKQFDIQTFLYFLVGFPGETDTDFQATVKFITRGSSNIDNIYSSIFSLMVNTPIFYSKLLIPQQLPPKILNIFTYHTTDGVTHEIRKARFLTLQRIKEQFFST